MLSFLHLAVSSLVLAPSFHDEGIVDGDADDLLNPLPFHLLGLGHVAGEVGLTAAGGKGSGHTEYDNLQQDHQ